MILLASILAAIGLSISSTNDYKYISFPTNAMDFRGSALVSESNRTLLRAEDAAFLAEATLERYYSKYPIVFSPEKEPFILAPARTLTRWTDGGRTRGISAEYNDVFGTNENFSQTTLLINKDHKTELTEFDFGGGIRPVISAILTNNATKAQAGFTNINVFASGKVMSKDDMERIYDYLRQLKVVALSPSVGVRSSSSTAYSRYISNFTKKCWYYDQESQQYTYLDPINEDDTTPFEGSTTNCWIEKEASVEKMLAVGVNEDGSLAENISDMYVQKYEEINQEVFSGNSLVCEIPDCVISNSESIVSASVVLTYVFNYVFDYHGQTLIEKYFVKAIPATVLGGRYLMIETPDIESILNDCQVKSGVLYKSPNRLAAEMDDPREPDGSSELITGTNTRQEWISCENSVSVSLSSTYLLIEPSYHARTTDE